MRTLSVGAEEPRSRSGLIAATGLPRDAGAWAPGEPRARRGPPMISQHRVAGRRRISV